MDKSRTRSQSNSSQMSLSTNGTSISYVNVSQPIYEEKIIRKKEQKFIIPLKHKPIKNYNTKKNMVKWLHTYNCDKKNIQIVEELFYVMIDKYKILGYNLCYDDVEVFTQFASWCFQNSSEYHLYK